MKALFLIVGLAFTSFVMIGDATTSRSWLQDLVDDSDAPSAYTGAMENMAPRFETLLYLQSVVKENLMHVGLAHMKKSLAFQGLDSLEEVRMSIERVLVATRMLQAASSVDEKDRAMFRARRAIIQLADKMSPLVENSELVPQERDILDQGLHAATVGESVLNGETPTAEDQTLIDSVEGVEVNFDDDDELPSNEGAAAPAGQGHMEGYDESEPQAQT